MKSALINATKPPAIRDIDRIVIHCSASKNGVRVVSEQIDRWHKDRGFARNPLGIGGNEPQLKHIGYHFVIYANGPVNIGRGEHEAGVHAAGFNRQSLGVCLVGTDKFSLDQWDSLRGLVRILQHRYPRARVCGHRDLSPDQNRNGIVEPFERLKTCPGFDVAAWLEGGMQPLAGHIL